MSGKSQYFNLYEQHVEQNPSVLLWALFSEKPEAISYVRKNYTKLFSGLMLYMPFRNDYRHAFAFPKQYALLELVLDPIAAVDYQKFPRYLKPMQHAITRIFMVMVAIDWWEGVEHLIKRHPDLWNYQMPDERSWMPPIHFLAMERFEWIEHKIMPNPDFCYPLLYMVTRNAEECNIAQVCAGGMNSSYAVEWFSRNTDMLRLENWRLSKAIHLAAHNVTTDILLFLIDLLDKKINALKEDAVPALLHNLGIEDPLIHTAEITLQKRMLREQLLYKPYDDYNYLTGAWMTGDSRHLRAAIERSMTPEKWIIDESSKIPGLSNSGGYQSPEILFDLLEIYPALTSIHFINMSFDWHDDVYKEISNLLYLNLLTLVFDRYFCEFNKHPLPKDTRHYIMGCLFRCIQKDKDAGLHITNTPEKTISIEPAVSSDLIKLSFLRSSKRSQPLHALIEEDQSDAQPRLPG